MEFIPISPPISWGTINIKVNISYLPKHIESILELTVSYSKINPNVEGFSGSSCRALTCILHNTYKASSNNLVIKESIGVIEEGFYLIEMTLIKGNNIGDSLSRVYGIWGSNTNIVIGLPYSIFKPIEFA